SIIAALKEDRRNGASIMALMKKYGLAKTTVWHHVKGISLSKSQIKLLRSNGGLVRGQRRQEVANARAEPLIAAMSEESIWPQRSLHLCIGVREPKRMSLFSPIPMN